MARQGFHKNGSKYTKGALCWNDLLGDPISLSVAEFKRRNNNLLGYEKLTIEEGDDEKEMVFYTVTRESHVVRGSKGEERHWHNLRHYDDSVFDPYADVYDELKNTIGKLDIDQMDDAGCERLAAAVLESVFMDYKYAYKKSKSNVKEIKKAGLAEMEYAVWRMENGIGSHLPYLPLVEEITAGLEAQVDADPRRY